MFTIVTLMPTVPTLKDLSTAAVIRDTLEMESRVLVCIIVFCIYKWLLGSNLSRYALLYCWISRQRHQPGIWTEVNNKRPSPTFIRRSDIPFVWRLHVHVHPDGHQHGGWKPSPSSATEFCDESRKHESTMNTFSRTLTVEIAKLPQIIRFLNLHDSGSLGSHRVTAASRKGLA